MTTQHLIFQGQQITPWLFTETPVTREQAISLIADGDVDLKSFHSVIAYDVESHWSDDVTDSIVTAVVNKWADQGEPLSGRAWEFVERWAGMAVARSFAVEDEYA